MSKSATVCVGVGDNSYNRMSSRMLVVAHSSSVSQSSFPGLAMFLVSQHCLKDILMIIVTSA